VLDGLRLFAALTVGGVLPKKRAGNRTLPERENVMKRSQNNQRFGMTILEVMLSLLILGGSVAVLSELARNALRNVKHSKDTTQAELLAESILAKVRIGVIEMESASDVPITNWGNSNDFVVDTNAVSEGNVGDSLWHYSLEVNTIDDDGLIEIAVTVRQNLPEELRPVVCRLVRWLALEPEEEE
jgi:Tfp pilus assembly protein PilV